MDRSQLGKNTSRTRSLEGRSSQVLQSSERSWEPFQQEEELIYNLGRACLLCRISWTWKLDEKWVMVVRQPADTGKSHRKLFQGQTLPACVEQSPGIVFVVRGVLRG